MASLVKHQQRATWDALLSRLILCRLTLCDLASHIILQEQNLYSPGASETGSRLTCSLVAVDLGTNFLCS